MIKNVISPDFPYLQVKYYLDHNIDYGWFTLQHFYTKHLPYSGDGLVVLDAVGKYKITKPSARILWFKEQPDSRIIFFNSVYLVVEPINADKDIDPAFFYVNRWVQKIWQRQSIIWE